MAEYQKINTLFKRDANNIIIPSQFTCKEFEYLANNVWEATEKIDGTNIRIDLSVTNSVLKVEFKGRTDRANIPSHLETKLHKLFDNTDWTNVFPSLNDGAFITLYGEGYGCKIQKGGNYLSNDVDFILFDVRVGEWWLDRASCEKIAEELSIKIVPLVGYMTIYEAVEYVRNGFKSVIAENREYDAEGLVLKTPCGLMFRNGERIILKIKTCDFVKFKNKYGEDDNPVQPLNTKYESL